MNWTGKRVFVTGHTGFKGSWLSLWLQRLGAEVAGYSLAPQTQPNMFESAEVAKGMESMIGDIRDPGQTYAAMGFFRPEVVFHLAAQPLVRESYADPIGTYATNVVGTASVLDAVRHTESVRSVVVVTTDKCYENREWEWAYRESDALGGHDPYSNSKACSELVVSAYRNSYFPPLAYERHGVAIGSVRAGNVIGGGDWSADRLVPDIVRAFQEGRAVRIRNPHAIRPWQHVLEPLRGYITLAGQLFEHGPAYGEAWNFGPEQSDARKVEWIVRHLAETWGPGAKWRLDTTEQPHEAMSLKLDCSKAAHRLNWRPALCLEGALKLTVEWYRAQHEGRQMRAFTEEQIEAYQERSHAVAGEKQL